MSKLFATIHRRALLLRPEVDHEDIGQQWADQFAKFFVGGVRQVRIAILFALERQNESVRESLVMLLGTVIDAPLEF